MGVVHSPTYIEVLTGDVEESKKTLSQHYDYIFFTGGTEVGKIVMERASKDLIPVTLELGGKSPAIIDDTIDLDITAKRIIYGKFINAGQTCIAPDYIMVKEELKNELIKKMDYYINQFFGSNPLRNLDYPKIINHKNHQRLINLIDKENIILGGKYDDEKIEPTILNNITKESNIMKEEIFGPILPMCTYQNTKDLIEKIKHFGKPLALYVFTKNKKFEQTIIKEISFGGATINDTIMHFANSNLPFGGVGLSGMGSYHGYYSFKTFSHQKGVVKRSTVVDIKFRYPPYESKKIKMLKRIIR